MKLLYPQHTSKCVSGIIVLALMVCTSNINAQDPSGALTSLPLKMNAFNAKLKSNKVILYWEVSEQMNISHYIIEKNLNGSGFEDAGVVIANDDGLNSYSFTDKVKEKIKGMIYYRLKVVSKVGKYVYSPTRIIKMEVEETYSVSTYPNPCVNELRVSIPQKWQDYRITYELYNLKGQLVKKVDQDRAGQTEVINVASMNNGMYALKITSVAGVASHQVIKAN